MSVSRKEFRPRAGDQDARQRGEGGPDDPGDCSHPHRGCARQAHQLGVVHHGADADSESGGAKECVQTGDAHEGDRDGDHLGIGDEHAADVEGGAGQELRELPWHGSELKHDGPVESQQDGNGGHHEERVGYR